jgi:integrase
VSAVFVYAIAHELAEIDPAASIRAALQPVIRRRQPALVKLDEAQAFLRAYEADPGYPPTKLASRLLALTAVRPGVIHMAEPHEFEGLDGPNPIWRIPAHKLKLERALAEVEAMEFIVPLSRQAVQTVQAALHFCLLRKYLFPSARHSYRPLTDNALNTAYRRVKGFEGRHVPHGWRSSFSTIMNERAVDTGRAEDRAIIDLMLAHVQDGVEPLYNRAAYMDRRREIAQDWADLLITPDFTLPVDFLPTRRR